MAENPRRSELNEIFASVDESERRLVNRLMDEVVYLEERMDELRKMPFILQHPTNPALQKSTPAAKQYKECSQSYMNAIRILHGVLKQVETSEQNDLLRRLEEFTQ